MDSVGTLQLGNQTFTVTACTIWGYLGLRDGKWYCRWCIDADAETRTFTATDDGESYGFEAQPSLSANTVPIEVAAWRDLDGTTFTTGEHGEAKFFDNKDHSAHYTLRTLSSFELCDSNRVELQHQTSTQFRVNWTGESFFHGVSDDCRFTLDAVATLKFVSLSSEVDNESDVDDAKIAGIFAEVFPSGDFEQHPAKVDRLDEDGLVTVDFRAEFTPK